MGATAWLHLLRLWHALLHMRRACRSGTYVKPRDCGLVTHGVGAVLPHGAVALPGRVEFEKKKIVIDSTKEKVWPQWGR